jgi:fructokinase
LTRIEKIEGQAVRPVIFGEVLLDHFPDGQSVLGGAPFNLSWNLRHLGLDPLFVGGVGRDRWGLEVAEQMRTAGLDRSGLQWIDSHPTGQVRVDLVDGEPHYSILPDQAYDHLVSETVRAVLPQEPWLLYHGTLALRSESNSRLCRELEHMAQARFVDVNLRVPWYRVDQVLDWIRQADHVKLNRQELQELSGTTDERDAVRRLFASADIRSLILVTAGSKGASIYSVDGGVWSEPVPRAGALVDAVGAGDAFASMSILGILRGWSPPEMLHHALDFAARVCTIRGATTTDSRFYEESVARVLATSSSAI